MMHVAVQEAVVINIMNNVEVSALIITYNQVNYVRDALNGAINQKIGSRYEVIVADDASTDGTQEVIREYCERYPFITAVYQKNNIGVFKNYLAGLSICKGRVIALCEGDDYWIDENKLSKQMRFLDSNQSASMVYSRFIVVDQTGNVISETSGNKKKFTHREILMGGMPHTLSVMFIKSALDLERLKSLDNVTWLDRIIFAMITEKGYCGFINDITAAYRINSSGIFQSSKNESRLINDLNMYSTLRKLYVGCDDRSWIFYGEVMAYAKYCNPNRLPNEHHAARRCQYRIGSGLYAYRQLRRKIVQYIRSCIPII